ncbi:hypothetical protein OIU74_021605 [Salix koriyanagi]|uniref:Uncharacterized protein n=1 Tax=Salix koriyanagi TaxID=2511006 RepID=A0A9Q0WIZ8_9ROSI|nr:hypothetical protein OIU74_021605 [Salix koriyanagi]
MAMDRGDLKLAKITTFTIRLSGHRASVPQRMGCSLCIPRQSWNVENLRPQSLKNWCLGQELYIRVFDGDPNPAKERPPPHNLLQFYAVSAIFMNSQHKFPLSNLVIFVGNFGCL